MKKTLVNLFYTILAVCLILPAQKAMAEQTTKAKNIIFLISDGWGYNHILATDYYTSGNADSNPYSKFPVYTGMSNFMYYFNENGELKQFSLTGTPTLYGYDGSKAKNSFDYVGSYYTDSAAAVTAMATGFKTFGAGIGVDVHRNPVENICEYAYSLGKATGDISSVQFSHATPAGFGAHVDNRNNYKNIAQQMLLNSKLTVIMGGGHPLYDDNGILRETPSDNYCGGISVYNGIKNGLTTIDWSREDTDPFTGTKTQSNGSTTVQDIDGDGSPDAWTLVEDKTGFQALASGTTPKRLFGLAKVAQTLQYNRKTTVPAKMAYNTEAKIEQLVLDKEIAKAAITNPSDVASAPYADALVQNVPTLVEMTKAALNVLDNDPDGFFLHIEGGAVDWAGHGNWLGRMIEEQQDFNNTVQAVIDWVEKNSSWDETLVIVTGDHETGFLTGPGGNTDNQYFKPVVNNGKGIMPSGEFFSSEHTNQIIPFYAKGVNSGLFNSLSINSDPVRGSYIDNTDIFKVMKSSFDGTLPTEVKDSTPIQFETVKNFPNPFNPSTTISFTMSHIGSVKAYVYNSLGQKVSTLVDGIYSPGQYEVTWNAEGMSNGTYFCKVEFYNNKTITHKMTLLK